MNNIEESYHKRFIALRYFFIGKGFFKAAEALGFASSYHSGVRRDGVTPEFFHQLSIAGYIRTLPLPSHDFECILIAALLHDVVEDYNISIDIIKQKYGERVGHLVSLMTNNSYGIKLPKDLYYTALSEDVLGAILKGSDRIHNMQTMVGVFTSDKQRSYIKEVEEFILPMLKKARLRSPEYEPAIENVKLVLKSQCELISVLLKNEGKM